MKIDSNLLFCAISTANQDEGDPEETGYLNKQTGEIVFLHENEGETEGVYGRGVAVDSVFDRARVEMSPDDWIEIPKNYRRVNDEGFINEFLEANGIIAELA